MKLGTSAAVAEIVSSIAIVVTLAYLAVETRQNTEALPANSRQSTATMDVEYLTGMLNHPEVMARLLSLDDAEMAETRMALAQYIRIREFAWTQFQAGILDRATLDSYNGITPPMLSSEAAQEYWKEASTRLSPAFVSYINSLLANH